MKLIVAVVISFALVGTVFWATTVAASPPSQAETRIYYLGQWEAAFNGTELGWEPEFALLEWADVRTQAQKATRPTPGARQCCVFGVTDERLPFFPGWTELATSTGPLTVPPSTIEREMSLPPGSIDASTLSALAFELLVLDATRASGRTPMQPNANLVWHYRMAGNLIFNVPIDYRSQAWAAVEERLQDDYAAIRARELARDPDTEKHLMWLDRTARKYRIDYRDLLNGLPDEGTVRPATPITETFNCPNADELDCDINWTESTGDIDISSNVALKVGSANGYAYADSNSLSSTDHYVEVEIDLQGNFMGPLGRWDGANEDGFRARREGSSTAGVLYDCVAASCSSICSFTFSPAVSNGDILRIELDGSDIDVIHGGNTYCDGTTDGDHSDHTQLGIYMFSNGSQMDNVEADILGAVATRRVIVID